MLIRIISVPIKNTPRTPEPQISTTKKGKNGFGYDPIFIPDGYSQTFGEMESKLKMSIDHRFKAFLKINKFFI